MSAEQRTARCGKQPKQAPQASTLHERELELRRDIAEAFFNAQTPLEVYRLALARVTPLVNASFSSVFVRDQLDPDLLRLVCASNWPQASARYLGQMRIRVGRGPTGRAVAEGGPVEVENVFADVAQREWWEPARELGFASLASLPLISGERTVGAVTFYYADAHQFNDEERGLLRLIAEQLSLTAERAGGQEELRRENEALREQISLLEQRVCTDADMQRLKTEFLANISHELRTPLTSILGYTYLLLEGQVGQVSDGQAAQLKKIDASASVLLRLINDLLALSELKLGRTELVIAPEDAVTLARRAASEYAAPPEVRFDLVLPTVPMPMRTDGEKVLRVLDNLLGNAFKFTTSGVVELGVRPIAAGGREMVEWWVRDTGVGIPPEKQSAIFDEFRQVDGSSTRLYGGTGMGLALSLRIAHLLQGDVMVESEPGRGSIFRLRLPLRPS